VAETTRKSALVSYKVAYASIREYEKAAVRVIKDICDTYREFTKTNGWSDLPEYNWLRDYYHTTPELHAGNITDEGVYITDDSDEYFFSWDDIENFETKLAEAFAVYKAEKEAREEAVRVARVAKLEEELAALTAR